MPPQIWNSAAPEYVTLVVPKREVQTTDFISAADAFVGGFVAAHCLRLSATQSLLWASAAGNLSLSEAGAQSSMASKGMPRHATPLDYSRTSAHDAFFSRPSRNLLTPAFAP